MPKSYHWTIEREITLIEFYAAHPIMWNPRPTKGTSTQRRKHEINLLLDELVAILDNAFTAKEVNHRFVTLRSTFRENLHKVLGRNMPPDAPPYNPTWVHYDRLSFLAKALNTRYIKPAKGDTEEDNSNQDPLEEAYDSTIYITADSGLLEEHDHTYFPSPGSVAAPTAPHSILRAELASVPPSFVYPRATTATKRKLNEDNVSAPKVERKEEKSTMDMYSAFGVQVADSLRTMGPLGNLSAARVMLRIQELLVKYHPDNTDNTTI